MLLLYRIVLGTLKKNITCSIQLHLKKLIEFTHKKPADVEGRMYSFFMWPRTMQVG